MNAIIGAARSLCLCAVYEPEPEACTDQEPQVGQGGKEPPAANSSHNRGGSHDGGHSGGPADQSGNVVTV
jgi:hypothetical protein